MTQRVGLPRRPRIDRPEEMPMAVTTPVFQPYRGETGRAWVAKEYELSLDTSSIVSSGTERNDTDDEVCSFDLGAEPYDPSGQERLPSDEWLDDHQQGLQPGSSEPRHDPYDRYITMPNKPSILDMMCNDMDKDEQDPPPSPERALTPTIRWDFDYTRDEPPVVQRIAETQRHSTPRPDPDTLSARPRPALPLPRPRASSAPPATQPAKRMALCYHPVPNILEILQLMSIIHCVCAMAITYKVPCVDLKVFIRLTRIRIVTRRQWSFCQCTS